MNHIFHNEKQYLFIQLILTPVNAELPSNVIGTPLGRRDTWSPISNHTAADTDPLLKCELKPE